MNSNSVARGRGKGDLENIYNMDQLDANLLSKGDTQNRRIIINFVYYDIKLSFHQCLTFTTEDAHNKQADPMHPLYLHLLCRYQ